MTSDALARRGELAATMETLGRDARAAAGTLALADPAAKNRALLAAAEAAIPTAPARTFRRPTRSDMAGARAKGLSAAMLDRLELNPERIEAMAAGLSAIAALDDPVGRSLASWERPNGLSTSSAFRCRSA